jgi:ankyrin repeat protein
MIWLVFMLAVSFFSTQYSMSPERQEATNKLYQLIHVEKANASESVSLDEPESPLIKILEEGADVNDYTHDARTPLGNAIEIGKAKLVLALLRFGADLSQPSAQIVGLCATPLHWAAYFRKPRILQILLEHGASINATAKGSRSVFSWALGTPFECALESKKTAQVWGEHYGANRCLSALLSYNCALPAEWNPRELDFMWFSDDARESAFGDLHQLQKKSLTHARNFAASPWDTPFHWAAARGHAEIISYLLTQYSKLINGSTTLVFNRGNEINHTAMDLAVLNGHPECAELLKQAGGILNTQYGMHAALLRRDTQYLKKALSNPEKSGRREKEINELLETRDDKGNTPLHVAATQVHTPFLNMLLHAQANPYERNKKNLTALQTALGNPCPGDLTYLCSEVISPVLAIFNHRYDPITETTNSEIAPELCLQLAHFVTYSHLQNSNPYKSHAQRGKELFKTIQNLKLATKLPKQIS